MCGLELMANPVSQPHHSGLKELRGATTFRYFFNHVLRERKEGEGEVSRDPFNQRKGGGRRTPSPFCSFI